MKFYGYSRCSTCRKALAWLAERGISVEVLDITVTPPSLVELDQALSALGRVALLNTSGQSYRALGAATVRAMDDAALLTALATDGRLVRRPMLITESGLTLTGFKSDQWQAVLGAAG